MNLMWNFVKEINVVLNDLILNLLAKFQLNFLEKMKF